VPHPRPYLKYLFEIIGGVVLLTFAGALWTFRKLLATRKLPEARTEGGRSSLVLGATITAVELPTAFPYFAAIAAVVGSGYGVWHQVFLILIFNVAFVLPLLAIVAILALAGSNAQRTLVTARSWLERHWPVALAVVGLVAGLFCVFIGITGLVGLHHGHAASVARRLRGIVAH
jgi:cytochrome c biogenesis protein CcdA